MPEHIEKSGGGFKVFGPHGAHSNKPMTLRNAKAQQRLLNALEHNPDFKRKKKKKKSKKS